MWEVLLEEHMAENVYLDDAKAEELRREIARAVSDVSERHPEHAKEFEEAFKRFVEDVLDIEIPRDEDTEDMAS
jgi:hypothetical protein